MKKKNFFSILTVSLMTVCLLAGCASETTKETETAQTVAEQNTETSVADAEYEPVTITLNLERSGLGENVEYTFTQMPSAVVASGDQMADFFFDLGLENQMVGYTKGSCWSTVSDYPARETVPQLAEPGVGLSSISKEELLATGCDFLVGWDSVFSEKNFSSEFCTENGIAMYFPYVCSDSATFEDLYKDYETLGQIFKVEDLAAEKIQAMKDTLQEVKDTLGEEAYENPISVFVYDSGETAPFTACQGMPGDIIKLAGGISIFDDIEAGWATPSWEEVIEREPDVILILDYNGDTDEKIEFLQTNEFTKNLKAVQEGRIYSACCADMQGSAGSAGTVRIIAEQLYPDLFQ
jgi:iron complex transport system substrate-binding protein